MPVSKLLKKYLTESKKIYEFKIKIVGKIDTIQLIKDSLIKFDVASIKHTIGPIKKQYNEFPHVHNTEITTIDISFNYPITSNQLKDSLCEILKLTHSEVIVKNIKEQEEDEINYKNYDFGEKTTKALMNSDYEQSNHQDLVGQQKIYSLLHELNKIKHAGEPYTDVNDQLLTKKKSPK